MTDLARDGLSIYWHSLKANINVTVLLSNIVGDNLGLHTLFGLTQGFTANACCRFCYATKQQRHALFHERHLTLRTMEGYDDDCRFVFLNLLDHKVLYGYGVMVFKWPLVFKYYSAPN